MQCCVGWHAEPSLPIVFLKVRLPPLTGTHPNPSAPRCRRCCSLCRRRHLPGHPAEPVEPHLRCVCHPHLHPVPAVRPQPKLTRQLRGKPRPVSDLPLLCRLAGWQVYAARSWRLEAAASWCACCAGLGAPSCCWCCCQAISLPRCGAVLQAARLYNEDRKEYNRRVKSVVEASWADDGEGEEDDEEEEEAGGGEQAAA